MDTRYTNRNFNKMFWNTLSIVVMLALAFPAFGSASALDSDPPSYVVGIVLPSTNERWLRDATEFEKVLQAAGLEPKILFSEEDSATEKANVETLISYDIQVLIICPVDASAAVDAVEEARDAGIKVISYDRLIRDTDAVDFYITFDGIDVGRAQGQYLIDHAQGSGNPLYLYAGALSDNNSFLFFEGAWEVLQPKIANGTFVIKNSSESVSLQGNPTLTRDEVSKILSQITTNWSYDDAINLAADNLAAVTPADKGNVFILAPNDGTARGIGDTFSADLDVESYILTGQDAEKESVQYIIYGKQSMTVFKDIRTLASDAASAAMVFLQGDTPASNTTYNNGVIDVPAHASAVVIVDRSNIQTALIDTVYYQGSDFNWNVPWRDDFKGPLADGWYWLNENADKWIFNDGFLRIDASPYVTGGENLLLRPVAPGDFMIKTRVLFEPDTNFQFAGLVIWQDENNFLQLGRAFCDVEEACVGNGIYFDYVGDGTWQGGNFATTINDPSDVLLRLERRGDMVRAFYSLDQGISWYEMGTHWIPPDFQVNGVGLTASQDFNTPDWDIPAAFDFFELTEGWGFLPEGFHDYDQGDVPDSACNAGGWAADPDNREADVNIEIVVDHQTVANLVAGEFRQDLQDAGVCVDGNCSFSTSLWGAISSYEPHRVDTWAQDDTGEWVLLSNSAKTLTCRTFDIYAFDPSTGQTRQITNLRETAEYNPSWSPNGRFIAHDVVSGDSHDIYVTNVLTGKSALLKGAKGGNDAAWSPNGLWIAFDRLPADNPNLYVVPFTGGQKRLVRENAVSADWSPTGLRIVFQDLADAGKLKTVGLLGNLVIKVADYGEFPAWSPDGKWIAYQKDGDIWKVRVGPLGTPLGKPIQVTSNSLVEGHPTWFADSKTIVFHSGLSSDYDLWTVPAAGGTPTWLTGAPEAGDYDPAYSKNGVFIAYGSFSPNAQAERVWVAAYSYDLPTETLADGTYPYHFDFDWTLPEPGTFSGQGGEFVISGGAPLYDGNILLRGPAELRGVGTPDGLVCEGVDEINPGQPMRFLIGWVPGYDVFIPMTYADAKAHFDSITAKAVWSDGSSADLVRHEIFPFTSQLDWPTYACSYTR